MERLGEGLHHTAHCLFPLSRDLPTCPQVSGIFSFLFTLTSLWNFSFPFLCPKKISCCPQLPPYTAKQKSPSHLNGGYLFVPQARSLGTWAHGNIFEWINHSRDVILVLSSFILFIYSASIIVFAKCWGNNNKRDGFPDAKVSGRNSGGWMNCHGLWELKPQTTETCFCYCRASRCKAKNYLSRKSFTTDFKGLDTMHQMDN